MSNKNDKDSYAQDTLSFSVPKEAVRKNNYPQAKRPQTKNPQQYQMNDNYEQSPQDRQQGYYQQQGQRPQGYQQQGQRPHGYQQQGNPSQEYRPHPQRPQGQQSMPDYRSKSNGQPPHKNQPPRKNYDRNHQNYNSQRKSDVKSNPKKRHKSIAAGKAVGKAAGKIVLSPVKKILIGVCSLLLFVFIIYSVLVFLALSKINYSETGERIKPSHSIYSSSDVRNILLIGNDSRGEDRGRSDSMILLSINSNTNKINLVSLMRDTYVEVPGYGGCKLNAAYSYGGPELLMDTIEENFYIDIDDYISINFTSFASIIDAIGGIEMEVSEEEADAINVLLDSPEGKSLFGEPKESDYLKGAGKYRLNGKQALSYSRLRKVGNADFERTERQRKVLTEIFKNIGVSSVFSVLGEAFPDISSNMSKFSMYGLSLKLPYILVAYDIQQLRIPAENTFESADIDGQSVLEIDLDANLDIIENKIYGK